MPVVAVVPAAGRGERFRASAGAGAKLVALIEGRPILDWTIGCLLDGGVANVVVVLPPVSRATFASSLLLADPSVQVVVNPDPDRGMLSSILAGLDAVTGDPILILPADMPFVRPDTVAAVIDACRQSKKVVSPRSGGRRGHPLALPGRLRAEILRANASTTLGTILSNQERMEIDVDDPGILRDVDVAADLPAGGAEPRRTDKMGS
jgi:molybdenum cofactor cytidylyltransferase